MFTKVKSNSRRAEPQATVAAEEFASLPSTAGEDGNQTERGRGIVIKLYTYTHNTVPTLYWNRDTYVLYIVQKQGPERSRINFSSIFSTDSLTHTLSPVNHSYYDLLWRYDSRW